MIKIIHGESVERPFMEKRANGFGDDFTQKKELPGFGENGPDPRKTGKTGKWIWGRFYPKDEMAKRGICPKWTRYMEKRENGQLNLGTDLTKGSKVRQKDTFYIFLNISTYIY